ncbi:MAG: adenylate kinase family protein [Candidatus Diapherotrites archaeon]|nr:adenylate kinase family protein [Candidatus Diapherotrites archaeon]
MIVVTGVPGTGKTAVARLLSKRLSLALIEVNSLVRKKKLHTGRENGSLVVDMKKLATELRGFDGIVEGHVLCELKLPATAVVLRTSPRALKRRLAPRRYSRQKLSDNVEAEALDYCAINAKQNYKKMIQVNTTGLTARQSTAKVIHYLKTRQSDSVDWSSYFLE